MQVSEFGCLLLILLNYARAGIPFSASAWTPQSGYSISGGITLGSTVTVTKSGGGFGTKPTSAKAVYAKFWEDGDTGTQASTTICRTALNPSVVASGVTVTSSPPGGMTNNALQYAYQGSSNGGLIGPIVVEGTNERMYLFARIRTNFDGVDGTTSMNQKGWRYWSDVGSNNLICGSWGGTSAADGNPRITAEFTAGAAFDGHGIDTYKNAWITEQVRLQQGSVNGSDADVFWIANGLREQRLDFISRDTGNPDLYREFYFWQEQGTWADTAFRWWCSAFLIDDSWCHAILSNSATYSESAGNSVEICPILTWADGTIEIYLRPKTGLNHLHIMDANGTTYYVGSK